MRQFAPQGPRVAKKNKKVASGFALKSEMTLASRYLVSFLGVTNRVNFCQ
ncbi:hypothetical protein HCH_03454 [Hahella chejuensis KCTC 2396]|uniref:Uncharacterized protein n=1 Tax=Hahella chejuensis (strain KCTC 2396) TaxID=349521 RepID=Q2SGM3_HAHCH|nr:hypothetical protein HCH_03454 [Hahella chejuensis KCTC 2396]